MTCLNYLDNFENVQRHTVATECATYGHLLGIQCSCISHALKSPRFCDKFELRFHVTQKRSVIGRNLERKGKKVPWKS